jgi:hypothetical protein
MGRRPSSSVCCVRGLQQVDFMRSAQQQCERAALCHLLAGAMSDPALREQLETAAVEYEEMAQQIERKGDKASERKARYIINPRIAPSRHR